MTNAYDAITIGSGLGGLTAAAFSPSPGAIIVGGRAFLFVVIVFFVLNWGFCSNPTGVQHPVIPSAQTSAPATPAVRPPPHRPRTGARRTRRTPRRRCA